MRAVYAETFGGDDPLANLRLGDVAEDFLAPGAVRVRVTAAALNHHDLWTLRGISSRPLSGRQVLGCDAAGTVEAVGEGVAEGGPAPGTRVVVHGVIACGVCAACADGDRLRCARIGLLSEPPNPGTLATFLHVPAANLIALPDGVDDVTAACLPTAYLTAYRMLFVRGGLRPGDRVLVQGAGGGVATAAILLARAAGVSVLATSRTEERRALALELGAKAAFDPADRATLKAVQAATGGGVDAVIDTVGEPTWDLSLRALRPGGTLVVAGTTGGPNPPAQLNRIFWRHITVAGTSMGTRAELARLVTMCADGTLTPLVDSVTPLEEAATAFARLDAGRQRGKMVIRVGE